MPPTFDDMLTHYIEGNDTEARRLALQFQRLLHYNSNPKVSVEVFITGFETFSALWLIHIILEHTTT